MIPSVIPNYFRNFAVENIAEELALHLKRFIGIIFCDKFSQSLTIEIKIDTDSTITVAYNYPSGVLYRCGAVVSSISKANAGSVSLDKANTIPTPFLYPDNNCILGGLRYTTNQKR